MLDNAIAIITGAGSGIGRATALAFAAAGASAVLDNRPSPPSAELRAHMMQPEDVAAAIVLRVNLPSRTLVEQIVMSPTRPRDMSAELAIAADLGRPQ